MRIERIASQFFLAFIILASNKLAAQYRNVWKPAANAIMTRWAEDVSPDNSLKEYPRPQMVRNKWVNLNGLWEYSIREKGAPSPSKYDGFILVPFPVESALSGVKKPLLPSEILWYRRSFSKPRLKIGERLLLHFGAVDWEAAVYINGKEVGRHSGGYLPFTQDITEQIVNGLNEIVVKVYDPTNTGIGSHGKQILNPSNIYYTPSSGIWQTVWLETVPQNHIEELTMQTDIERGHLLVSLRAPAECAVEVIASSGGKVVGVGKGKATELLTVSIKNPQLWSPSRPFLYDLSVTLIRNGKKVDNIQSYFGMRKIDIQKDENGVERIFLNNKPFFNLGTLDQGFWPDGLYTAPTDEALKFDIEAMKNLGFNTIRKHIKIEPARWYYHADKIGVLVWQDFVNPNQGLPVGAKEAFEAEVKSTISHLRNHPSITTWVVFNEKWGAYDQGRITDLVKKEDPTRIVDGHSGEMLYVNKELRSPSSEPWVNSDVTDVHSYPYPMNAPKQSGKARVLGEFGGIGVPVEGHLWDDLVAGWGYQGVGTPDTLKSEYEKMTDTLLLLKKDGLSASIYTQPYDVESEQNGIMTYDRKLIKIPISFIRKLNLKLEDEVTDSIPKKFIDIATISEPSTSYSERKRLFDLGQRDSTFLRRFAIMALQQRDTAYLNRAMQLYIDLLLDPYASSNVRLIVASAISTEGAPFHFLYDNIDKVNQFFGPNAAERLIMAAIYQDAIKPFLVADTVTWDKLDKSVIGRFGDLGQEKLVSAKMAYYLNKKDWKMFGQYFKTYYKKVLITGRNEFHINNLSWKIFQHVDDLETLSVATKIMAYNLEKFEPNVPSSIDTYANLLYKIGRRSEALHWQKRAVELSNNDKSFVQTYTKMVNNEKTWQ